MTTTAAPSVRPWTAAEVEDLIIDLLADYLGEDTAGFRRRLLEKGTLMPIDSLDLFDVLQDFRQVTGLSLPVRKLRRNTMRSVRMFAEFVEQECKR